MLLGDFGRQDQSPVTSQGLQPLRIGVRFIPGHFDGLIADALRVPGLCVATLTDEGRVLSNGQRVGSGPVVGGHRDRATWPRAEGSWVTAHPERAGRYATPAEVGHNIAQPDTWAEISLLQT